MASEWIEATLSKAGWWYRHEIKARSRIGKPLWNLVAASPWTLRAEKGIGRLSIAVYRWQQQILISKKRDSVLLPVLVAAFVGKILSYSEDIHLPVEESL